MYQLAVAPPTGRAGGAMAHSTAMGLARRLAVLTALLAVALVLGATEIALRWSERMRLEDRQRAAEALADTWSTLLARVAPSGDPAALSQALASWPSEHVTATGAAVFTGRPGALVLAASSDSEALAVPARHDSLALARRGVETWFAANPAPAWHVAVPVGGRRPYGVFHVWVSTATLDAWARQERRRGYLLAGGAALLVAAGVGFLTSRWVGRPLRALGDAMRQAHGGVEGSPAAPELGPQEFRGVARRYNELRAALGARQRESASRAALLGLEERARGLDRIALLEETSRGFAHEIGTPLNTVSGHLQLLRDDLRGGTPAALDRVQLLLGQVERLARIVRAQLERGSWPAPSPAATDLAAVGARLLEFLAPTLDAAGISATQRAEAPALAWADGAMVEQVLLNLLKNAVEAMTPGGRITLATGATDGHPWLEVSDTGPGLAPAAQHQLFNPFASSKGPSGTGLGLYVSRRLARALGGDLVHVPTERGTTWRLVLPPLPGAEPEALAAAAPAAAGLAT